METITKKVGKFTWTISKNANDVWPTWGVQHVDGDFCVSQNLFDCLKWAESKGGRKVRLGLLYFAGCVKNA